MFRTPKEPNAREGARARTRKIRQRNIIVRYVDRTNRHQPEMYRVWKYRPNTVQWAYTKRDPLTVKAERRAANKRAKAARKVNR